jgi:polysaccharide biosynthesis protein PslH
MRILYVTPFVPWPIRVRSYNLIPRLSEGHEIHLCCLARSAEEASRIRHIDSYCASATVVGHKIPSALLHTVRALASHEPLRLAYFHSREMSLAVETMIGRIKPDVMYGERWRSMQYFPNRSTVPIVIDPTDSMTLYNRRLMQVGQWRERMIGTLEHPRFEHVESRLARDARFIAFCSQVDRAAAGLNDDLRAVIVPNGVDCKKFVYDSRERNEQSLVFTGNFHYGPNRIAIHRFLKEILPLVRTIFPDVRLTIAGYGACELFLDVPPGVEVAGYVDNLQPFIAKAAVAVVPLTVGAGVTNKVLEAFAVGTPVVSTNVGLGDLAVRDQEHLLIANVGRPFANAIVRLLQSPKLGRELAQRAHTFVANKYDWPAIASQMDAVLRQAVLDRTKAEDSIFPAEAFSLMKDDDAAQRV